jgi:RNA polymerase sigma factor (TIGR02999 family)
MPATTESVTRLLTAVAAGDAASKDELLQVLYDELRRLARDRLGRAQPGTALQATELVHEVYIRLFHRQVPAWNSRGHFFTAAAQAMRNIAVEQARSRGRVKRGGGRKRAPLDDCALAFESPADDALALDEVLKQLERTSPRKARVVLLHCFSGLTLEETAAAMDVSLATVEREWRFARAVLRAKLEESARTPR